MEPFRNRTLREPYRSQIIWQSSKGQKQNSPEQTHVHTLCNPQTFETVNVRFDFHFGSENIRLLFTDMDSLAYLIKHKNQNKLMAKKRKV